MTSLTAVHFYQKKISNTVLDIFEFVLLYAYTSMGIQDIERNDNDGTVYSNRNELRCLPDPRGKGSFQSAWRYLLFCEPAHELDGSRRDSFFLRNYWGSQAAGYGASVKGEKNQMETETARSMMNRPWKTMRLRS